jgi:hypothetical protein
LGAHAPEQADKDALVARNEPFDNLKFFIGADNEEKRAFRLRGRAWFDEHGAFAGYRGGGVEFTAQRNAPAIAAKHSSKQWWITPKTRFA